jgi:hypothetical protein
VGSKLNQMKNNLVYSESLDRYYIQRISTKYYEKGTFGKQYLELKNMID